MLRAGVVTVAVNQTPLDWIGNVDRILRALRSVASAHPAADLVLFPELCISGYGCEDAFHSPDVHRRSLDALVEILQETERRLPSAAVIVGLPIVVGDHIYNCAVTCFGGAVRGISAKTHLAGDGVHYEPRWFNAWRETATISIPLLDQATTIGSPLFELGELRFVVEICEDAWVPDRPALRHLQRGVDLILNPSASHFAFGKYELRRRIVQESSRSLGCGYAMVNLLGNEAGRMIYDGSTVIAAGGEILREDRGFSFGDFRIQSTNIDLERLRVQRSRQYSFVRQTPQSPPADPAATVRLDRSRGRTIGFHQQSGAETSDAAPGGWTDTAGIQTLSGREAEFLRACTLGLFDYMRKSHSRGFVISLSGGADSATCAVLVQRMLAFAIAELGPRDCLERLGRRDLFELIPDENHEEESGLRQIVAVLCPRILDTLYQSTRQSSETTRSAARRLAEALSANHNEVAVDPAIDFYSEQAAKLTEQTLDWSRDDLALQNIQARARAPMIWMLANLRGALLLTTSNRSEAAVGYCTMDGDTAGGLAPIAGVDKNFIQHWLRWMEVQGDWLLGPVAELTAITAQAPTAELRPADAKQTDEGDLMPYAILDRIERLAIRDRKAPDEILSELRRSRELSDNDRLGEYVSRFFQLWSRNQWKRERYAPSFHLDDVNLDPRSWYRFPILNGGYRAELDDLDSGGGRG